MKKGLRLAHIAVHRRIADLAGIANAPLRTGADDMGPYRYFDLDVCDGEGTHQVIRFASHDNDTMVHILAENINAVGEIAAALFAVGVRRRSRLSISTDQKGSPLRDRKALQELLAEAHRVNVANEEHCTTNIDIGKEDHLRISSQPTNV